MKNHNGTIMFVIRQGLPWLALMFNVAAVQAVDNQSGSGQALYQARCAMCHGQDAKPTGSIPDLRRSGLSQEAFEEVVRNGWPDTIMLPMKDQLNHAEIAAIRTYIKAVSKK